MLSADLRSAPPRTLQRRLYAALRRAILSGVYPAGTRLPATRTLAAEAGVARQTVVLVYERLLAEGYATGRVGAGTFVAPALTTVGSVGQAASLQPEVGRTPKLSIEPVAAGEAALHEPSGPAMSAVPRSAWAGRAMQAPEQLWDAGPIRPRYDFRPGVPDWNAFPHATWRRLLTRRWRGADATPALAQYGDPAGYRPLREALAAYLARSRGVRCTADHIVIVSGSQQALDLLVRVCLNPADTAAVEDPGYPPARAILAAAGVRTHLVPVDGDGLDVASLSRDTPVVGAPRMVYVTPSHQYPSGATLSLPRRLDLLTWAAANSALIVEDDYDSELRYAGPPLPALQGLDERGCVVYVGSCSSVLFPPLRVGWIVAPPPLVPALVAAKWLADRQTATLDQQVLADFIAAGHFERHLRRSRRLYAARRAALVAAVRRHLPSDCVLGGDPAGLDAPLLLPPGTDEAAVVTSAAERGVAASPIASCYGESSHASPGLLLGFASTPEGEFDGGVRRLGAVIRAHKRPGRETSERLGSARRPAPHIANSL